MLREVGPGIMQLTPTNDLVQNEIDVAKAVRVSEFNVQNQQKIEWPRNLIVAGPRAGVEGIVSAPRALKN